MLPIHAAGALAVQADRIDLFLALRPIHQTPPHAAPAPVKKTVLIPLSPLAGKKVGDQVFVEMTGPASHENEDIRDKPITVKIDVTDRELNGQIAMMAIQQGRRPEKLRQEMARSGQLETLYGNMRQQKTLDAIPGKAKVAEAEPEAKAKEKPKTKSKAKSKDKPKGKSEDGPKGKSEDKPKDRD